MAQPQYSLTPERISRWITHWLTTSPEAYLGSSYGFDAGEVRMRPLSAGIADGLVRKLRADIPLIGRMPADAIAVLGETRGPDELFLTFVVGAAVVTASLSQSTGMVNGVSQG